MCTRVLLAAILGSISATGLGAENALLLAASRGDTRAVKSMLQQGTDVNRADDSTGLTALTQASFNGHIEVVRILIEAGADVNRGSNQGLTPLTQACVKAHDKIVTLLLSKGAKVNTTNTLSGLTPLAMTVALGQRDRSEIVALLLKAGADVNAKDEKGRSVLMLAPATATSAQVQEMLGFKDNDVAIVKLLLRAGARLNDKDNDGLTALDYAEKNGRTVIVTLLKKALVN